ncbi:hypothetical protein K6T79_11700 [Mycolicibacter sp. MYC098]|uniref:Uncharacterized protein n=1 Tax=[Mycobacterium] crassicus TaxID=2872309 RepID=A0ABU5XHE5_9MYCO|nr:hypothetical protein [Mycolicibacter sp. MYC098]MEB3021713.1 hypothetical protein [Mycolicibacter sp. MYC098]
MCYDAFGSGPGFGWPGFGHGPGHGHCGPGHGDSGFGFGHDGPGFGFGGSDFGSRRFGLKRVAFGTLALLLDGPADAAQIVERVSAASGGAFTPPREVVDLAFGLLAGRGLITLDGDVATLSELGKNLLSWRGVSSETAHAFLARAGQFGDVIKIRWGLVELAGLARKIFFSGTDEQKAKLTEARTEILAAIDKAKKSLYSALAT